MFSTMDPGIVRLGAALEGKYSIRHLIGEGLTSAVYRATDLRHDRDVAIKVLKPEVAASLGSDRFLREIQTTAALQHPHILPLFDSGRAGELVYYVTPLVDGQSLQERLRGGPLPVDEAVRLTEQIGAALTYAHERGLVHRDIKPANVLLSSGRAILADFGIAGALGKAGGDRLTATGLLVGTPQYMSPEQFEGDEVDGRSDLYALGCVVFEMLTGEPPVSGKTAQSIFARRVQGAPPSTRALRDTVPPAVDAAVQKALARSPVDRFATVADFVEAMSAGTDVRRPTARRSRRLPAVVLGSAVVALIAGMLGRDSRPPDPVSLLGLAVLPFELRGDTSMSAYLDVMHADVVAELQGLSSISVSGVTSSRMAAAQTPNVRAFAETLGADMVLAATMWMLGDSVRLGAELLDGETESVVRTITMAGGIDHLMGLRGELVLALADSLEVQFSTANAERLRGLPDVDPRALELYMRAQGTSGDLLGLKEQEELLSAALEIEPEFADAWLALGGTLILQAHSGAASPRELIPRARDAGSRALALDPNGRAMSLFAHIAYDFEFDWAKADSLFAIALERHPSDPLLHQIYGAYLTAMLRLDEAERAMRRAAALDPLYPFWTTTIAWPLSIARPEDALIHLDTLPETHRLSLWGRWQRVIALQSLGRHEEVIAAPTESPLEEAYAGTSLALAGDTAAARGVLERLEAISASQYFPQVPIADIYAALQDNESALDWLELAFEDRDSYLPHIREFYAFEQLADEPRFQALMSRMDFPDVSGSVGARLPRP